jgi:dTMP kinase
METKGKLIVIDGGDGSGKATQTKLLVEYLEKINPKSKHLSFPRYNEFYGNFIGHALQGEFGDFLTLNPYLTSPYYAMDRYFAKPEMEAVLESGGYLILDRYTTSNMGHQGGKFKTQKERDDYLNWLIEMEYEVNKLPKEDIVLYLYVDRTTAQELTQKETDKHYVKENAKDLSEHDTNYQMNSEQMFLYLCEKYPHWHKIECMEKGKLLPIQNIHEKVLQTLKINKLLS